MRRLSWTLLLVLSFWSVTGVAAGEPPSLPWAFSPPKAAEAGDGIDRLVQLELAKRGWRPSPPAPPAVVLRRVFLALTGLPPTPTEAAEFLRDPSPEAYARVVDRLLASPHFGERWATVWLDLARFADTQGYEKDNLRTIWAYRDWVIQAFNDDLPFDQFTIEQLAGDLLPQPTPDQLVATAFHRNTMTNTEGGTDHEEFRIKTVIDRTNTTGTVWLGVSLGCAQCHDHPNAPITQRDYYAFLSFFNNTEDADRDNDRPLLTVAPLAARAKVERLRKERRDAEDRLAKLEKPSAGQGTTTLPLDSEWTIASAALLEAKRALEEVPETTVPILRELPADQTRETFLFRRGDWRRPLEKVTPAVPSCLPPATPMQTRLDLARWLVSGRNPLTARVQVNRLWAQLFGTGLVPSVGDLATTEKPPRQQPLLDWLASAYAGEWRWSTKRLLREIVLSKTFCQSSQALPAQLAADPQNEWLARGPHFRWPAEVLRDQALAAAGLLSERLFGPSVMPPQPEGTWQVVYNIQRWRTSPGEDRYRRGLYTFWRRTSPYPGLALLDAPSREGCTVARPRESTPAAALTLLNDPAFAEAADALGRRLETEGGETEETRLRYGWRLVLVREPSATELEQLRRLFATTGRFGTIGTVLLNLDEALHCE